MSRETEYMTMDEAVDHIMLATGKNRRQARAELNQTLRAGLLPAFGTNTTTGEFEEVPPEHFLMDR